MDTKLLIGFGLVLLAGMMNGTFAVPMKYARQWSWENIWLAWSAVALVVIPVILTLSTVPPLREIYAESQWTTLGLVFFFGAGWGISQVCFGLGVSRVGVAVGFAIIVGLAAAVGALVPLLVSHSDSLLSWAGLRVLIAVGLIVAGVSLCAWAGKKKEQQTSFHFSMKSWSVRAGIVLCVLAGVGGSMINLGLVFGAPILEQASHHAVPEWHRTNALWLPLLLSGFGPTALYCSYRLQVNHTWGNYARLTVWSYWGLALLMGVLWFGSVEVYGVAAGWIGDWGPVLGWPVFLSTSIATANVWGILTGEWKEASPTARRIMRWGLALLIASIFILGFQSGRAQP